MTKTEIAMLIVTFSILAWDVYLWKTKPEYTISARVRYWSKEFPLLPFLIGFLIGHWYG